MASFLAKPCSRVDVAFQQSAYHQGADATEQALALLARYSELILARRRHYGVIDDDEQVGLALQHGSVRCSECVIQQTQCDEAETPALISSLELAQLRGESFTGEFYTYMMSHNVSSKTDSYVGYTTNPLWDVYMHNERLIPDRNTGAAAGKWELDVVLGPFASKHHAMDCGRAWVDGTRGKLPKRKKAPFLSKAYGVDLYDRHQQLDCSFESFLDEVAPPVYSEVYREMCK